MLKRQNASVCEKHLLENIRSVTNDRQAHTDSTRPNKAWARGWDRFKGQTISFEPIKPFKITWEDVQVWRERMIEAGMKKSSINAYDSALKRAWEFVYCDCPSESNKSVRSVQVAHLGEVGMSNSNPKPIRNSLKTVRDEVQSKTAVGFKLSVCQKSLSLALKHAWAHNQLATPPVCPVDRIILNLASQITGESWRTNWTDVNSYDEYEAHVRLITKAASPRNIAVWELLSFENLIPAMKLNQIDADSELLEDGSNRIQLAKLSFIRRFSGGAQGHQDWSEYMLKDCLRSSLQHNGTYLPTTPESAKTLIRASMRALIVDFLVRWEDTPEAERTMELFKSEMSAFQLSMNSQFGRWFR